jgi:hypothetical protein
MKDSDRFRLLGTYRTPRVKLGRILSCEYRDDDVIVVGYSDGRIPWPLGRRRGKSSKTMVMYGDLVRALKVESNLAICYWWGVTPQTVTAWRKALGVEPTTKGTSRLRSEWTGDERIAKGLRKAMRKARDPDRRAKISAARNGVRRSKHVIEAMRKGRKGKPHSAETRRKMSLARRRQPIGWAANGKGFTPEDDHVLRTMNAREAATKLGRSLASVYDRRRRLGLPDGRKKPSLD